MVRKIAMVLVCHVREPSRRAFKFGSILHFKSRDYGNISLEMSLLQNGGMSAFAGAQLQFSAIHGGKATFVESAFPPRFP